MLGLSWGTLRCPAVQMDESVVVQALGPDKALAAGGPAAAITVAEQCVAQVSGAGLQGPLCTAQACRGHLCMGPCAHAQGRLWDAADALRVKTAGTAAAAAVEGWCADACARAAAEQGVQLLRAHATGLAAAAVQV
jgi:hypothetical protein